MDRGERGKVPTVASLGGRLLQAQEAERAHIAGELHDNIGQQISVLAGDLSRLADHLKTSDPGQIARQDIEGFLNEAVSRVHVLAKSVHELSHRLLPAKLRL